MIFMNSLSPLSVFHINSCCFALKFLRTSPCFVIDPSCFLFIRLSNTMNNAASSSREGAAVDDDEAFKLFKLSTLS